MDEALRWYCALLLVVIFVVVVDFLVVFCTAVVCSIVLVSIVVGRILPRTFFNFSTGIAFIAIVVIVVAVDDHDG